MILVITIGLVAFVCAAHLAFNRPAVFVIFLLAVGSLRFGGEAGNVLGGSLNTSSLWLLCMIVLAGCSLLGTRAAGIPLSLPEKLYGLFLCWCAFEAYRAESLAFAARLFLKLLFPLLVMALARRAIRSEKAFLAVVKWTIGAALVSSLVVGGFTQRFLPSITWTAARTGLTHCSAAIADYASLMALLALVCWRSYRKDGYLVLAIWLAVSSAFVGIRTGVAAVAVGAAAFFVLEFEKRKAIPIVIFVYLAAAAALFILPSAKARMFADPDSVDSQAILLNPQRLSWDDIRTSGRSAMWEEVLDRFWKPNQLIGSGLGATQAWFYGGGYGELRVEHSEYVRLLSDAGIIGLALFVLAVGGCMVSAWRIRRVSPCPQARSCAVLVLCTFPVLMVCMAFDNVLNYVLAAGQYPFAFTGIMFGLAEGAARRPSPRAAGVRGAALQTSSSHVDSTT